MSDDTSQHHEQDNNTTNDDQENKPQIFEILKRLKTRAYSVLKHVYANHTNNLLIFTYGWMACLIFSFLVNGSITSVTSYNKDSIVLKSVSAIKKNDEYQWTLQKTTQSYLPPIMPSFVHRILDDSNVADSNIISYMEWLGEPLFEHNILSPYSRVINNVTYMINTFNTYTQNSIVGKFDVNEILKHIALARYDVFTADEKIAKVSCACSYHIGYYNKFIIFRFHKNLAADILSDLASKHVHNLATNEYQSLENAFFTFPFDNSHVYFLMLEPEYLKSEDPDYSRLSLEDASVSVTYTQKEFRDMASPSHGNADEFLFNHNNDIPSETVFGNRKMIIKFRSHLNPYDVVKMVFIDDVPTCTIMCNRYSKYDRSKEKTSPAYFRLTSDHRDKEKQREMEEKTRQNQKSTALDVPKTTVNIDSEEYARYAKWQQSQQQQQQPPVTAEVINWIYSYFGNADKKEDKQK